MSRTKGFNWPVFSIWIALMLIGLIAIYSATQGPVSEFLPSYIRQNFVKQIIWIATAIILVISFSFVPPRSYIQFSYIFYALTLILVGLTIFFGTEINGAKSWIRLGPINIQSSELMKLATIMATASYLTSRRNISTQKWRHAIITVLMILVPVMLIILQNDLGSALVFIALIPVFLFWSGLPYGTSLLIISPAIVLYLTLLNWKYGAIAAVILALTVFILQRQASIAFLSIVFNGLSAFIANFALTHVLQPHQVSRIIAFTNPYFDPKGVGWNIIQSKTAIGSGGLYGKGFLQGTQTQYRFIPEQWTDFISCVIGEEFGFIGLGFLVFIYTIFFIMMLRMAGNNKHPYAQLVIVGVTTIFFVHFFINLGSATALLPIIGLPLPFVSYGGSALLSNALMLAVCLNMDKHKRMFSIYR